MNKFDQFFFRQYVSDDATMKGVAHKHMIVILDSIIINYFFGVILPCFLYYFSLRIQELIPFFVLEIFIICIFLKNIYDIFEWYNDAWIITNEWITELKWEMFAANATSVRYANIEWLKIVQTGLLDTLLGKWDIVIHKIGWWENNFVLKDARDITGIFEEISQYQRSALDTTQETSDPEQNFDTIIQALSGVVEWYLQKNGYGKNDEDFEKTIQKIQKNPGTIDLRK